MRNHKLTFGILLGLLLGLGGSLVYGQPFVILPQPVNVTNADGTAIADITGTSLNVNCTAGCAAGAAFADNSAFTAGTTGITNIGGVFNDALGAVGAGNAAAPRITAQRGLHVNLRTVAGSETGIAGTPLRVDPTGTTTQPVSGTVTTSPPANASTNVTQFGGNAVVTGTGASGVGIPRVTVANDSTVILGAGAATIGALTANQSVNITQFGGNAVVTGTGASGVGIPRVTVANDSTVILGAGAATIGALTANQSVNLAQVAGTNTVTGGVAGSQSIGGVSANNTAITQNPVLIGVEALAQGTQPGAATTGNQRRALGSLDGALYVQEGNSNRFSCFVQAVTVTTQCQAAPGAGLRAYVVSAALSNQAATVQTLDIIFGTGANCVTAPTALTHKFQFGTLATTTSPHVVTHTFHTPLIPTAANAICVRPSAATAFGATLTGFIAP